MKFWFYCSLIFISFFSMAQDSDLPYSQITEYPDSYSSGNILSRMVDGLGFRYYWATEGLTQKDLDFSPSEGARTTYETMQHIYGLSKIIVNAPTSTPNSGPTDWSQFTYETLRAATLQKLKKASELYAELSEEELAKAEMVFQNGDNRTAFPIWNMINGPIADAIWHTGQVVSFRRSSGNPFNSKVSLLQGKLRN